MGRNQLTASGSFGSKAATALTADLGGKRTLQIRKANRESRNDGKGVGHNCYPEHSRPLRSILVFLSQRQLTRDEAYSQRQTGQNSKDEKS